MARASGLVAGSMTPYRAGVVWYFLHARTPSRALLRVRWTGVFLLVIGLFQAAAEDIRFPADAGVIDVTLPPYLARGDGRTDNTEALQQALLEHPNQNRIIYLPNGTYLISAPLRWPVGTNDESSQRATILQGQSRTGAVIRLADHSPAYTGSSRDAVMLWMGDSPAWRERNAVRNLTLHTGVGNTVATGIALMANRQGGVRDVTIIAGGTGEGVAGIDAGHSDAIGPALIKNVRIEGFDYALKAAYPQYSLTLEHVEMVGQRAAAIRNTGQTLSIRDLRSTNAVPALLSRDPTGFVTLLDSVFHALPGRRQSAALQNNGFLFALRLTAPGYTNVIQNRTLTNLVVDVQEIDQFSSHPRVAQFKAPVEPLNLPVEETPEVVWDPLDRWASPLAFGGKPNDEIDDGPAIQKAIDSGATTVYLPNGNWRVSTPVEIRGAVHRLIGCEARIFNGGLGPRAAFKVVDGSAPVVIIERLVAQSPTDALIEHASTRRLVISSCSDVRYLGTGRGDLFIEDVSSRSEWLFRNQKVWARQWTIDRDGSKIINRAGTVWILGLKTERPGTVIATFEGGKTELCGGLIMATGGPKFDPMFVIQDASASLIATEIAFQGSPYRTIVSESRGGTLRILERGLAGVSAILPTHAGGTALPFYAGFDGPGAVPPPVIPGQTNAPRLRP